MDAFLSIFVVLKFQFPIGSAVPSTHPECHSLVQHTVVADPSAKKRRLTRGDYHRHVASYFQDQAHSARRTAELPWQLERAGEYEKLEKVLSEPRWCTI